ncbi:SusD/RagB family nutrient-binding outer membrane lipoprotein [Hymenobacter sp. UV11]|uniref:SusD/RagB family nutrient-binding outer membrane lipoprotein n=1 Tax=Hymenobacter sp. UV11 TaxID=1849735 RepID=UPI001061A6F7|nr:SusD/RagB family nutrient-binding outer membrane lipoprotein [Hymenobacter sp. UV11]TDN38358.1 hypothetical protein A8B98_23650 [Hymenobacter sp. UV11]TFZ68045.1 SusD/RagB family nutrient-binding outer membrane lipoprotein [Hymenobacter sp. UV11]
MKKAIIFSLSTLLLATSCVDSLTDYNVDIKNPAAVPGVALFSNAERTLTRTVVSTNVNLNPFRLYVQYWAETSYPQESRYNIDTRQINRAFWDALYTGALSNLSEAKKLIPNNQFTSAAVQKNQQACVEILAVYTWKTLVDTYGNIPYTEALDFNNAQPKYDDAKTIYASLFTRLDAALASLNPSVAGMGDADILYSGNVASWVKFGNSLKLRMALTIADDDAAKAATAAVQAAPNVFKAVGDKAQLQFISSPPNTNPLWEDLIQSGRYDFVGADTFVNQLNTLNDPRRPSYFKLGPGNAYVGGPYGALNTYNNFSAPGTRLEDPTLPGVLLSYSEVEFLLAEAAARNIAVGGTAASHYNAAVTASIIEAGGSASDVDAYLAQPTVAYATAAGTYKQKIGIQKWIALYDQPVVAWTEWRRLDSPTLVKPARAISEIPVRFPYPSTELNLNGANNAAAAAAIGGDLVTTKIFWDKF